jgi:hypothetical protein
MEKVPVGRTIACIIAGILVVVGVFFLFEAYRVRQEFYRQSETRPLDIAVDFSKTGEYTAPFSQTWRACHGQTINLHVPTNVLAGISPSNLLASLDFKWQITDPKGKVVVDDESSGRPLWQDRINGGSIPLVYFHPFDLGEYRFKCTVNAGAPTLSGVDQRLVCQYQPCGLEMLSAFLGNVVGIAALVIAGIILLVVTAITKRKQRQIRQPSPAN